MHGTKADKLYDSAKLLDVKAQLDLGDCGIQEVTFYHEHRGNVDFVFVDHPVYHRAGARLHLMQACIVFTAWSMFVSGDCRPEWAGTGQPDVASGCDSTWQNYSPGCMCQAFTVCLNALLVQFSSLHRVF